METYYKVQQHRERGWEDIGTWVRFYDDAEKIALTLNKPKTEHIRILEKKVKNEYSTSFSSHFIRGSVKRGVIREER